MAAMLGWLSDANTVASRLNRARRSASCANAEGSVLSATSRPSLVSRARKTSPIPPAPSDETISYSPSRVPGGSDMNRVNYIGVAGPELEDYCPSLKLCDVSILMFGVLTGCDAARIVQITIPAPIVSIAPANVKP